MNRIIKRTLTVSAAAAFAVVAGCTDLTVEPKSQVTETNVFRDPSSYRAFLARVYAGLAVTGQRGPDGAADIRGIDEGFSQYLRIYWEAQELPTDEAVIGWGDVGLPELNTQLWAPSNLFVNAMYYRIFFQIMMANEFLRQTTDAKLDSRGVTGQLRTDIQTYRAEARFLRALSYWHGLDLFGSNIPLVTEADPLGSTPPMPATGTEIYDFIVSELTAVKPNLLASTAANYGRATQGAADMLLAKVYMNAQVYTGTPRWTEALAAASAVIAAPYSLVANYRNLFLADNNATSASEIIFPVLQDGLNTQTWGGATFLVHASCGGAMNSGNYGHNGCWWGLRMKAQTYNRFATNDGRALFFTPDSALAYGDTLNNGQPAVTVSVTSIGDFKAGVPVTKFTNRTSTGGSGSHAVHPDTDFPMFRLADAYLIYAEAHLRGGGGSAATALNYVNALRTRAFGGTGQNWTAAELTLDSVLAERGRELLWEGHRRTDLIRYGLYTGGTYLWEWKGGVQAGAATGAFRNLYPIPANELIANPNLTQNPGY
jgi:starch-binding outer membrane protein, SusD/RagB family